MDASNRELYSNRSPHRSESIQSRTRRTDARLRSATAAGLATPTCCSRACKKCSASRKSSSGYSCFPLLLAFGLGIAFRNKPADITSDRRRRTVRRAGSARH